MYDCLSAAAAPHNHRLTFITHFWISIVLWCACLLWLFESIHNPQSTHNTHTQHWIIIIIILIMNILTPAHLFGRLVCVQMRTTHKHWLCVWHKYRISMDGYMRHNIAVIINNYWLITNRCKVFWWAAACAWMTHRTHMHKHMHDASINVNITSTPDES